MEAGQVHLRNSASYELNDGVKEDQLIINDRK
jgi:hypothetical protein